MTCFSDFRKLFLGLARFRLRGRPLGHGQGCRYREAGADQGRPGTDA